MAVVGIPRPIIESLQYPLESRRNEIANSIKQVTALGKTNLRIFHLRINPRRKVMGDERALLKPLASRYV